MTRPVGTKSIYLTPDAHNLKSIISAAVHDSSLSGGAPGKPFKLPRPLKDPAPRVDEPKIMAKEMSAEGMMAVALQGLGLEYTHVRADSGESLWHVPITKPNSTILTLFVGPFTAGVTCLIGDFAWGQVHRPFDLLRLNATLTLAKVALRDEHLYVQAEIPTDQVTAETLKLAITTVLEGVTQAKSIAMLQAAAPAPAANGPVSPTM